LCTRRSYQDSFFPRLEKCTAFWRTVSGSPSYTADQKKEKERGLFGSGRKESSCYACGLYLQVQDVSPPPTDGLGRPQTTGRHGCWDACYISL